MDTVGTTDNEMALVTNFLPPSPPYSTRIERFPDIFARVHGAVRRAVVSRFPYAVFYRIETKRIVVLAIIHTARDPNIRPRPRKIAR